METADTQEIRKHVRKYVTVFIALLCLTLITVGISRLHLDVPLAIGVALLIATVKGGLVASYFMHLVSEKKVIYATLILTVVFFAALMSLPLFHHADPVVYHHVP